MDPCSAKGACGLNAYCSVTRHRKQCVCPQDFTGNPEVECVRIPSTCYASSDCPQPLQCSDGICMPSCTSDESCALNERCLQGLCMCKYFILFVLSFSHEEIKHLKSLAYFGMNLSCGSLVTVTIS